MGAPSSTYEEAVGRRFMASDRYAEKTLDKPMGAEVTSRLLWNLKNMKVQFRGFYDISQRRTRPHRHHFP